VVYIVYQQSKDMCSFDAVSNKSRFDVNKSWHKESSCNQDFCYFVKKS